VSHMCWDMKYKEIRTKENPTAVTNLDVIVNNFIRLKNKHFVSIFKSFKRIFLRFSQDLVCI
jgi:predicted nucleic acid-binding OB-fold protein